MKNMPFDRFDPAFPRLRPIPVTLAWAALAAWGLLFIHLGRLWFDDDPTPSVRLFGQNLLSSLGCMMTGAAAAGSMLHWLARRGVDRKTLAILALSAALSLFYIHTSRNYAYTNDWDGHYPFSKYISRNFDKPYGYRGWQEHHPPLYYYMGGTVLKVTTALQTIPDLTALRFLSWCVFLWFQAFGVLILGQVGLSGVIYYASVALFALWPASVHIPSRISNEPLFYALFAASFYYLLRWYRQSDMRLLQYAVAIAFLSLAVRTGGIVLLAIVGAVALTGWRRRYFRLRELIGWRWGLVALVAVLAIGSNVGRLYYNNTYYGRSTDYHFGVEAKTPVPLRNYYTFNYREYLDKPFNSWSRQQSFWSYTLKTLIYGEYRWDWPRLARALNLMLLLMVVMALAVWCAPLRSLLRKDTFPLFAAVAIAVASVMVFSSWKKLIQSQDARYLYFTLPCMAALYGLALEMMRARGGKLFHWMGIALAIAFVTTAIVFYWPQVR